MHRTLTLVVLNQQQETTHYFPNFKYQLIDKSLTIVQRLKKGRRQNNKKQSE